MGIIRLLLALSVVIAHSRSIFGISLVGGALAVQAFFMISGFYMAHILTHSYVGKSGVERFFRNRFLKIFPMYWVIALITMLTSIFMFMRNGNPFLLRSYLEYQPHFSVSSLAYLILSNIYIFGQDVVMFFGIDKGNFFFTTNFWETNPALHSFLLIPAAWSLSLELVFYLLAPKIILFSTRKICLLILASCLFRGIAYVAGLNHDPWTYRFFPFEGMFFLLGILIYRLMSNDRFGILREISPTRALASVMLTMIVYPVLPMSLIAKHVLFLLVFWLSIPALFRFSSRFKIDRKIGELSYPVYLSHWFIINILNVFVVKLGFPHLTFSPILILPTVISFSYALHVAIAQPIERFKKVKKYE